MPRLVRLEFKNAIHYVHVRGRNGSEIFFDVHRFRQFPQAPRQYAPHVQTFELLLAAACTDCGAFLHGYCLEPNSGVLVLQTAGASLQAFMQRLSNRYSRYLRAGGFGEGRGVFGARYDSKVVAPEYLPHAVRRTHRSPIVSGLCRRRLDYPFSSERAYTGERAPIPINMTDLRDRAGAKGVFSGCADIVNSWTKTKPLMSQISCRTARPWTPASWATKCSSRKRGT